MAGSGPDTLILLQHAPVYTAGKRTQPGDRPIDGTPVVDVDRGGRITWHGPGQLVVYPIVKLAEAMNVVGYVRLLEQAIMAVCTDFGLSTLRVPGRSGVWLSATSELPERKVAAIGVRVAKGVTSHGLALNCDPDMSAFDRIVPCGIADAGVTSLSRELGRTIGVREVAPTMIRRLIEALDGLLPIETGDRFPVGTDMSSGTGLTGMETEGPVGTEDKDKLGLPGVGAATDNGVQWKLSSALVGG